MPRSRPGPCGKLYISAKPKPGHGYSSVEETVGDVCGLPAGHEGEHQGRWHGKRWYRTDQGVDMLTSTHPATRETGDASRNPGPLRD